jgi:hypothetical protein
MGRRLLVIGRAAVSDIAARLIGKETRETKRREMAATIMWREV